MIRRYTCLAILVLLAATLSASPTRAQDTHTITIDFEDDDNDGCIDTKSITVAPKTKKVKKIHGNYSHQEWFDGDMAATDAPEVTWTLAKNIAHYKWSVEIKDRSKRQFFGGVPRPVGPPQPAKNDAKKVDKWPYFGAPWKYKVIADYTGSGGCAPKEELDPQVKFKGGAGFLPYLIIAILLLLGFGGFRWARRGRATP